MKEIKSEPQNQGKENRRTAECRISNVEGMNSIDFIEKTERAYSAYGATKTGSNLTLPHFGTYF
jgi:hypothetical protein